MSTANKSRQSNNDLIWMLATAVLTFLLLYLAATNLANYLPVSGDDGWIMSVSYKLATEGVFGSDMYAGLFNADTHYFFNLPFYHLLQAAAFKFLGFGVAQARLPNLFSVVLLIWITSSIAYRHYGRSTALLTAALLILWRSNLTTTKPRVPILTYANTGRYDITAVLLVWSAVLLLDHHQRHPRPIAALALGLLSGLATLTQFFGSFILLPIAITFWRQWGWSTIRQRLAHLFGLGFLLIILPYSAYILAHPDDFTGQLTLKGERAQLTQPAFYLENILTELHRYSPIIQSQRAAISTPGASIAPFGPWLLTLTIIIAALYLVNTLRLRKGTIWRIPWLSLLCFTICFTLFDQTKAPIYAILLLPGICLALAVLAQKTWRFIKQINQPHIIRQVASLSIILLLAAILLEGANSYRLVGRLALNATSYEEIGRQIKAEIAPDAVVLGSERWWPALKDTPYLSLNNLWAQWRLAETDGRSPQFSEQVREISAEYLIVNNNVRGDLISYPEQLQTQFWNLLTECGALLADWTDLDYDRIQIYQLEKFTNC